jgi:predicted ArsR family transcriptional regulator
MISVKSNDPVLAVISREGPVTAAEIATAMDRHPVTVRRHCRRLQQAGHIETLPGGGYVTTSQSGQPTPAD